jgi:hypothetical protein
LQGSKENKFLSDSKDGGKQVENVKRPDEPYDKFVLAGHRLTVSYDLALIVPLVEFEDVEEQEENIHSDKDLDKDLDNEQNPDCDNL